MSRNDVITATAPTTKAYDVTYKVLLLGDSGVGKTSLLRSLSPNSSRASRHILPTVGIDFMDVVFTVDGARVRLQIWDTAGQERFRSMTRFQYRGTKGLLLVYDVTNSDTFNMLSYWMDSIEQDFAENAEPIPVVVVGNKTDMCNERKIQTEDGRQFADRNVSYGFYETSAVEGTNVMNCFQRLADVLTDIYNPELTNTHKFAMAMDKKTRQLFFPTLKDPLPLSESKPIKLKPGKRVTKCGGCAR